MVEIKVFRADLEPEECAKYVEGHQKVLQAYGVTKITSADLSWMGQPYSYIIIARDKITKEVLGGGRIQMVGGNQPLPIETAIDDMDQKIFDYVEKKNNEGCTGEYCGLWNSRKIAGYGIGSRILMRVGVAIMQPLKMSSLLAFVSPATLNGGKKLGFQTIKSLGNRGTFYYPKEDLVATALILKDPLKLQFANANEREKIFGFRTNPIQKQLIRGPKGRMEIYFDLKIKQNHVND